MQLTYVFSELGNGLRRNVSMTVAVVVTLCVSLTLVGLGLLLNAQADKAEEFWGDRLQITVYLCTDNSTVATCIDGKATEEQKEAVVGVLDSSDEVESYRFEDSRTAYDKWREVYGSGGGDSREAVLASMRPKDFPESYRVTLEDPREFQELKSDVETLAGVGTVQDLRRILQPIYFWITALKWGAIGIAAVLLVAAILQVGNTIRLAAYARRKEIGIMRLVGASSLYIQLPFLLESLVAAVLGVALAGAAVFGFLNLVVYRLLRPNSNLVAWVDYSDGVVALVVMTVVGLVLTLVPTLLLTRRYLKV